MAKDSLLERSRSLPQESRPWQPSKRLRSSHASMRAHLDDHAAGTLQGSVPGPYLAGQGLELCTHCGLLVSSRYHGVHPRCRPATRAAAAAPPSTAAAARGPPTVPRRFSRGLPGAVKGLPSLSGASQDPSRGVSGEPRALPGSTAKKLQLGRLGRPPGLGRAPSQDKVDCG